MPILMMMVTMLLISTMIYHSMPQNQSIPITMELAIMLMMMVMEFQIQTMISLKIQQNGTM
jgi:hypothetical protein